MINRRAAECRTCGSLMLLRISIDPVPQQRLLFPCPHCGVDLRLQVDTPEPPVIDLQSLDLTEVAESQLPEDAPVVLLSSAIPVRVELLGRQRDQFVSPFLEMMNWAPGEAVAAYSTASNMLYGLYGSLLAPLRRIAPFFASGDLAGMRRVIDLWPNFREPEWQELHPVRLLGRCFELMFAAIVDVESQWDARIELLTLIVRCFKKHPGAYERLLSDLMSEGHFPQYRRKVTATSVTLLEDYGALLPGLAWEKFDPPPDPREFRILRDDFDLLRARYVDVFELASQAVAFVGYLANLSNRESARRWCDGRTANLGSLLRRRAVDREFILSELPAFRRLYDNVSRQTRNRFGHYSVEYDSSSGELIESDGARTNYVLFLADYLSAARMCSALMLFTEKLTLEIEDGDAHHAMLLE